MVICGYSFRSLLSHIQALTIVDHPSHLWLPCEPGTLGGTKDQHLKEAAKTCGTTCIALPCYEHELQQTL